MAEVCKRGKYMKEGLMLIEIREMIRNIIEKIDTKIPLEDNPEKLEILKKKYQIALQEIERDNQLTTNLNGMVRQYLDSYSDYINNPLIQDMERLEAAISELPRLGFVRSDKCNDILAREILGGRKMPHSTSHPVIYLDGGKYYLAVFVFFYTKNDIENGTVDRPTVWAIADIETGSIIKEYETKEKDFSDASYGVKYNVHADGEYDTSKEYYDRAFTILDSVRSKIISDGKFYKEEYQYYLNMILANIPKEYQRFYTDLSI